MACSRPKSNRQVWVSGVTSALAAVKSTPKSAKLSPHETGEQWVQVSDLPIRGQNLAAKELLVGLVTDR